MNPNIQDFQQSITQELDVIKNRVRSLIGDAHWGEEGRYKEIILQKIIKRIGSRRDIATEAEERILAERRCSFMVTFDA